MSEHYNKPEVIIIDYEQQKIKDIFYGFPKNPIEWPSMKPLNHPGEYFSVLEEMYDYVKNGRLVIPGGYRADHERCQLIYENYVKLHNFKGTRQELLFEKLPTFPKKPAGKPAGLPEGLPIYKEFVIEMQDGKKYHYSKWKTIKIINWNI